MTRKELLAEAELGFAPAEYQVGADYYAEHDLPNAAAWYQKAAEGGFAPAQAALGDMYSEGLGVGLNPAIAAEWHCKAAEQGHARALTVLLPTPPSETSAKILPRAVAACRNAASDGNADALCWLAIAHEEGIGVELDSVLATRLYNAAVIRGLHKPARSRLGERVQRSAMAEAADRHFGQTPSVSAAGIERGGEYRQEARPNSGFGGVISSPDSTGVDAAADRKRRIRRWGGLFGTEKREWLLFVGFIMLIVMFAGYVGYSQQRAFNAMTPAKHLEAAQEAFRHRRFEEALTHAQAITTGPEVSEARKIEQEVFNAREAEFQRFQAALSEKENRAAALNQLQTEPRLRSLCVPIRQARRNRYYIQGFRGYGPPSPLPFVLARPEQSGRRRVFRGGSERAPEGYQHSLRLQRSVPAAMLQLSVNVPLNQQFH
jgi:hypothetical protein